MPRSIGELLRRPCSRRTRSEIAMRALAGLWVCEACQGWNAENPAIVYWPGPKSLCIGCYFNWADHVNNQVTAAGTHDKPGAEDFIEWVSMRRKYVKDLRR